MDIKQQIDNYEDAIKKVTVGYNKSITISSVTMNSLTVLDYAMDEVKCGLQSIVSAFEEMQATSSSTASHTEQIDVMMESILSANENLKREIGDRVQEIASTSEDVESLAKSFVELKEQTKKVTDITGNIQEVVDKTNVLAINASIEAAHAGSFGAGFKIIANEVHKLANQTGDFARQITERVKTFENTVESINEQMNEFTNLISRFNTSLTSVLENFSENAQTINNSGQSLSEITLAMREEAKALTEGLSSLEKVNNSMKDTHTILGVVKSIHEFLDELLSSEK